MEKKEKKPKDWIPYYENNDILEEITDEDVDFSLDAHLRKDILSGNRKRKLKNITIKIDPLHIMAIKKLANMKAMPYQTLIRHWLAHDIKQELDSVQE